MTPEKYREDLEKFKTMNVENGRDSRFTEILEVPTLTDDTKTIHHEWSYVLHTAWAARVIAETKPKLHVDVSSYIYFATTVSAFVPVKYYEFRHMQIPLSNIQSEHVDLQSRVANAIGDRCYESVSCMHTLEHIGLGRYGDTLDMRGDYHATQNVADCVAQNGNLLIVVPVGRPRLEFNSSRTYSYEQAVGLVGSNRFDLVEFTLIPDTYRETSALIRHAPPSMVQDQINGTGCFWFKRRF